MVGSKGLCSDVFIFYSADPRFGIVGKLHVFITDTMWTYLGYGLSLRGKELIWESRKNQCILHVFVAK